MTKMTKLESVRPTIRSLLSSTPQYLKKYLVPVTKQSQTNAAYHNSLKI